MGTSVRISLPEADVLGGSEGQQHFTSLAAGLVGEAAAAPDALALGARDARRAGNSGDPVESRVDKRSVDQGTLQCFAG